MEKWTRAWDLDNRGKPSNPPWTTCLQTCRYMSISVTQWMRGVQNLTATQKLM